MSANLETFKRDDGTVQVMAAGWPLYDFASGELPGDANGQGVNDIWWVLDADGVPIKPTETPTETRTESDSGASGYEPGMFNIVSVNRQHRAVDASALSSTIHIRI